MRTIGLGHVTVTLSEHVSGAPVVRIRTDRRGIDGAGFVDLRLEEARGVTEALFPSPPPVTDRVVALEAEVTRLEAQLDRVLGLVAEAEGRRIAEIARDFHAPSTLDSLLEGEIPDWRFLWAAPFLEGMSKSQKGKAIRLAFPGHKPGHPLAQKNDPDGDRWFGDCQKNIEASGILDPLTFKSPYELAERIFADHGALHYGHDRDRAVRDAEALENAHKPKLEALAVVAAAKKRLGPELFADLEAVIRADFVHEYATAEILAERHIESWESLPPDETPCPWDQP